jgi:hypothetical protein
MLSLDYTLCERSDCPSAATCDRYQTLARHFQAARTAVSEIDKAAANYALEFIWIAGFEPDISGKCSDYIAVPIYPPAHPESQQVNTPFDY